MFIKSQNQHFAKLDYIQCVPSRALRLSSMTLTFKSWSTVEKWRAGYPEVPYIAIGGIRQFQSEKFELVLWHARCVAGSILTNWTNCNDQLKINGSWLIIKMQTFGKRWKLWKRYFLRLNRWGYKNSDAIPELDLDGIPAPTTFPIILLNHFFGDQE